MHMLSPGTAFILSLFGSFGPCVAPRYLAIVGLGARWEGPSRWLAMAAFASGLICAHASLVFGASVLLRAEHGSRVIYGVLAAASLSLGLWTLVRSHGGACCNHVEQRVRARDPEHEDAPALEREAGLLHDEARVAIDDDGGAVVEPEPRLGSSFRHAVRR